MLEIFIHSVELKNENMFCIFCKYSYEILHGEKKCLSNDTSDLNFNIPLTTEPLTTKPLTTQPLTTETFTTPPPITEPLATQPLTTEQSTTRTPITEPLTTKPSTTEPFATQPLNKTNNEDNKICSIDDAINNKCNDGKIDYNQINEIKENLLNSNYTKNNTIIKTENVIIQLSTIQDQKYSQDSEISNIDFGECEQLLKDANGIPPEESLIVYKTDIKSGDLSSTYVIYEVYNPLNLEKLGLSVCAEVQINIDVPVTLNTNLELIFDSLTESGYNICNKKDSFYQDICSTFTSSNGTDILLSDRKKYIYTEVQNQSMCQTGCELLSYNQISKKAKCNCTVEENLDDLTDLIDLNIDNFFINKKKEETFFNTLSNSNFRILKCYKLILNLKLKENIGGAIMSIIILTYLISLIIFCFTGHHKLHKQIENILKSILMNQRNNSKRKSTQIKRASITRKNEPPKKSKIINKKQREKNNKQKNNRKKNNKQKNNKKDKINKNEKNSSGNIVQKNIIFNVNVIKPNNKKNKLSIKKNIAFLTIIIL